MMDPCYDCTRKHLTDAEVYMMECVQGYIMHGWRAVGQLDHAANEIFGYSPAIADRIRQERLKYMDSLNEAIYIDKNEDGSIIYDDNGEVVLAIDVSKIYNVPILSLIKDVTVLRLYDLEPKPKEVHEIVIKEQRNGVDKENAGKSKVDE
jgi:hypothetical protein